MSAAPHASSPEAPFARLAPALVVAGLHLVAVLVWLVAGDVLPGGRWLAVHLFTVGVLSVLVLALTQHFAETILHAPPRGGLHGRLALLVGGGLALLTGFPSGTRWLVALGALSQAVAVSWLYLDLRRTRKASLGSRFGFVVRAYERATAAFLHGAILGALMGTAVAGGAWYGAVRLAHLHVNVLGWGAYTLLATVVFFGPTMLRARIRPGADRAAARGLRVGMSALTVAVLALVLTALDGTAGVAARLVASAGLAVFAGAGTMVCAHVLQAARSAKPSAHARLLTGACLWMPPVLWADALLVATGRWDLLDALGVALLVGVLAQAILGAAAYLAPMVLVGGAEPRQAARERLEGLAWARPLAFNAGTLLAVVGAALGGTGGAAAVRVAGWALVAAAVVAHLGLVGSSAWPRPKSASQPGG